MLLIYRLFLMVRQFEEADYSVVLFNQEKFRRLNNFSVTTLIV